MALNLDINWLLLVLPLPTQSATARMRVWRGLKSLGCMALRDGAYLLPGGPEREQALRELGDECTREGGVAWLMSVQPRTNGEAQAYQQLFDRSGDYADLRNAWKEANRSFSSLSAMELTRLQRKLQRDYDAAREIDFFPGDHHGDRSQCSSSRAAKYGQHRRTAGTVQAIACATSRMPHSASNEPAD